MEKLETLFSRDSKGKIKQWNCTIENMDIYSVVKVSYGLLNGKQHESIDTIEKGKNQGKANETSHYEQALSEGQSRWKHKNKEGYKTLSNLGIKIITVSHEDKLLNHYAYTLSDGCKTSTAYLDVALNVNLPLDNTDENGEIKPMKAQPYFKDNGEVRISFPCYGQPKINGFRCVAKLKNVIVDKGTLLERTEKKVIFTSKLGLEYNILEHIENEFRVEDFRSVDELYDVIFDGEMYIHGEILSEISSAVRKRNSKTSKLQFHIFDIAVPNVSQKDRMELLNLLKLILESQSKNNSIKIVPNIIINNNEEAQAFCNKCISEGYEGAIFRDMKATYQFGKRPQTMVKLKRTMDKEYHIVDIIGGEVTKDLGIFVCTTEQGLRFNVTPNGTEEQKREYLSNKQKYIGKQITVVFHEYTKDNKPFHITDVTLRDYE